MEKIEQKKLSFFVKFKSQKRISDFRSVLFFFSVSQFQFGFFSHKFHLSSLHFQIENYLTAAELNSGILFRTVIQILYPDKNQILDIKSQIDFFIAYFISRVGHKRLTLHALCQKCKNHFIKFLDILSAKIQSLPLLDRQK